jgi:hypothetical protein
MFDTYERSAEFALIETVAETIRGELGDEVEACPGFQTPEQADPLNRVFRALTRRILEPIVASGYELSDLVTRVLRELVTKRLTAGGLSEFQIRLLLDLEPGVPDDWLTFLILVPWAEILYWLKSANEERG